ncbi:A24 family peptidase [Acinetobacter sp. MD2(2019)]|uniref:prepilin peptidase n=1 Tax=Acinetobacter sp. MD2(2019) TaxID=2605273 RepID=UPI002D1F2370|nr:A24 family peptidase [Acinetobacter sp. MD2(2019)]MEB3754314.1 prepilin peptidase [Acinetobacter sp. MD2(2019)]
MSDFILFLHTTPIALYTLIALLGLCVGSFLNVVIYRTPKMMQQEWQQECQLLLHPEQALIDQDKLSLSHPASACPNCQHPIRWYQNIPIVSWLLLKGQCAACKHPISIRYPLIELLSCICSIIVVYHFGSTWQMLAGLIFTWVLIALTFIDFDTQLLPDRFTFSLLGLGLAVNSVYLFTTPILSIWGSLIGFLCLWLVYIAFKLITGKEGMGYGDFKLLAALGAWLGPLMLPLIILLSSVVGAIVGIVLLKVRKQNQAFAFGPYLAIAGWIAFLYGESIMKIYLGN